MQPIQGQLPFSPAAAGAFNNAGNPKAALAGLGPAYSSAYTNALDMNSSNYSNILSGYHQTAEAQDSAQNQIAQGYAGLDARVMGGIDQVGQARRNDIADQYAKAQGNATQGLIDRGLSNSTVTSSVNRGLEYDRQKSETQLSDDLAQMRAGYQSNIGLANLGYLSQANNERTGLAQSQLGWMNSVNAPYPDAGMYAGLAQQYGSMQGGGMGSVGGVAGTAGPVTKGGTQFAPNSNIDWNASTPPPVQGAGGYGPPPGTQLDAHPTSGGYVQPPGQGFAGAAAGGVASQYAQAQNSGVDPNAEFDPGAGDAATAAASAAMDWAATLY